MSRITSFFLCLFICANSYSSTGFVDRLAYLGFHELKAQQDEKAKSLKELSDTYVQFGSAKNLKDFEDELQAYDVVWRRYLDMVVLRGLQKFSTLWHSLSDLEAKAYVKRRYLHWLVRGADRNDLDFLYNGTNHEILRQNQDAFYDPQSPLFSAIPEIRWHVDPNDTQAFEKEKQFWDKYLAQNNLSITDKDAINKFLDEEQAYVLFKVREQVSNSIKSVRTEAKSVFKEAKTPFYLPYYDKERQIPMPWSVYDLYSLEFSEVSRTYLNLSQNFSETSDLIKKMRTACEVFQASPHPFRQKNMKELELIQGIARSAELQIPSFSSDKFGNVDQKARPLIITLYFALTMKSIADNFSHIPQTVKTIVTPLRTEKDNE